jgi:hypothetical protein
MTNKCELCGRPILEQPPSRSSKAPFYDLYQDIICNECYELCYDYDASFETVQELRMTGMCLDAIKGILWERWERELEWPNFWNLEADLLADQQIEANDQAGHILIPETTTQKVRKHIRDALQALRDSCLQGIDGSWEVNDEGFQAMGEGIERVAKLLGIQLDDYKPKQDDEE